MDGRYVAGGWGRTGRIGRGSRNEMLDWSVFSGNRFLIKFGCQRRRRRPMMLLWTVVPVAAAVAAVQEVE